MVTLQIWLFVMGFW